MLGTLPSRQFPAIAVKATTALTSSYVAGTIISADEHNMIAIELTYTKGDETSLQLKVEGTNDDLTDSPVFYQQVTQTASGGTVTIAPAEYSVTAASMPTVGTVTFIINPVKGTGFRVSVKATGGTPTGTYAVKAYLGWV